MGKFKIELDERQLRLLCTALDLYARLGMGQWETLLEFFGRYFQTSMPPMLYDYTYPRLKAAIDLFKQEGFGLTPHASKGIFNPEVPRECREAYDIHQVLRGMITPPNSVHPYMAANEDWPPVVCERLSEE